MSLRGNFAVLFAMGFLIALRVLVAESALADAPEATFSIVQEQSLRQNADLLRFETRNKDKLKIVIEKQFGIGKATISSKNEDWPKSFTIEFCNFQSLEQLQITSGTQKIDSSIPVAKRKKHYSLENGVGIRQSKRSIYVTLPRTFLKTATKEIHLNWIDFYR